MKKELLYCLYFVLSLSTMCSLVSCGEDRTHEYFEITEENQWTFSTMKDVYLWADEIKSPDRSAFFDRTSKFFSSLLAKNDRVSFFTDSISDGSYGVTFSLMRDPLGEKMGRYYALVLFVEPDSPADIAGIRRGTWISALNNKALTSGSSEQLLSGAATKVTTSIIEYDDESEKYFWVEGDTLTMPQSEILESEAIYLDTIYNVRSHKAGYIVCCTMNGKSFVREVEEILLDFATKEVTDIIVDLRYCNGGSIENAAAFASALVPTTLVDTPFATLKGREESADTIYNFSETLVNVSDKRLFFIIGNDTKGAAELLVASVDASRSMHEAMTVGANSAGNNLLTKEYVSPYGFSINPAVATIYSADSTMLPASGITPDYAIDELQEVEHIYPLGSQQEYILRNVEYIIANGSLPATE